MNDPVVSLSHVIHRLDSMALTDSPQMAELLRNRANELRRIREALPISPSIAPAKIIIVVSHGCVSDVYATNPNIEAEVVDLDANDDAEAANKAALHVEVLEEQARNGVLARIA